MSGFDFFAGGSEMAALMRGHDWAATSLGTPAQWPVSLKTTIRLLLTSEHPMFIWWGPNLLQFYNDAYRQTMGPERHPSALGQRGRDCWAEIWDVIGPQIDFVMAGKGATWHEDHLVPVTRHGKREEVWWTYGFSPIEDEAGVRGVLVICNDVTEAHRNKDELVELNRSLAAQIKERGQADTERKHANAALHKTQDDLAQQVRDWQSLHEMGTQLVQTTSLSDQLLIILKTVAGFNQSNQGLISLYDSRANGLVTEASLGLSESGLKQLACVAIGDGACGRAFAEKGRVIVGDTETDPMYEPYRPFAREQGIRSVYSTPFFNPGGGILGVLSLYFSTPRRPDEREMRLADICASQAASFVARARAEGALHLERDRSHDILQSMGEGFIWLDKDFRVLQINAEGLRIDGRPASEILGRTHWEAWPGSEELPLGRAYKRAMRERIPVSVEQLYPHIDGRNMWFESRAYPSDDGLVLLYHDITDKKRAEEALRDSETRLHQLANTIPQLAWMANPDGWIHWYNDRWYAYTGTTPAQMEGWGWQSVHDPDVLPKVMEGWTGSIASGEPFQMTFPLRDADGVFRPFFTWVAPLRDASGNITQWFGTNTDISAIQEAEEALRKSEERLKEGLLAGRMVVWDWDIQTGKVAFSETAEDVFGQSWNDTNADWESVHPDDLQQLTNAANRAIEERSHYQETVRMIRPDNGQTIWIDVRGKVLCNTVGTPNGIRGISIDITERKRAEDELRQADRQKDEFLAMLAHELRNPLAPIDAAAEILKLVPHDEKRVRQASEIISRQAEHMMNLVDDLLDVSRVTRGLVTLDLEPLDLKTVVAIAVEQVAPLIESRRHRLTLQLAPEPVHVHADRVRLVQVLANLLTNAAKYTPEGGEIVVSMQTTDDQIAIAVQDNGIGITPMLLSHVFDLFAQGERTSDRSQGGLGLGLALVKSLMELHDGSVTASSDGAGMGSLFTMRLPRLVEPVGKYGLPKDSEVNPGPGQPLRVMIVDDNADAAQTTAILLEAHGHFVSIKSDAGSVLEWARIQMPQVFILDIGLPDMDGCDLAKRLKAIPETSKAVLIALTGYDQTHDRERSRNAGFDFHLVKPVDMAKLLSLLVHIAASEVLPGSKI